MKGLHSTRPGSAASAICPADQSTHFSSPVMTSSSTHESTRVAGLIAARSVATEQRHDLVGTHAIHGPAGSRVPQSPHQALAPSFGPLGAHDRQGTADLDNLYLVARIQDVLRPQMRRDSHLTLAVQHHDALRRVRRITPTR